MDFLKRMKRRLARGSLDRLIDPRHFQPRLPLPARYSREQLLGALEASSIDGSAPGEMAAYVNADFERFIHTMGLVAEDTNGRSLEIGANPYFNTLLFRAFRPSLKMDLINYFGGEIHQAVQHVSFPGFDGIPEEIDMAYFNANLELHTLPFEDDTFDVVLFCEVLEHLTNDPLHAMMELKRILKPGGQLVLTTPNAARLENVSAFIEGRNMYDPYSKYGAYGRHNREYTRHELVSLLKHCGFDVQTSYTANVHDDIPPRAEHIGLINAAIDSVVNRKHDLGQYLFTSSINASPAQAERPSWLFRSYPPEEMV
ncbi:class I SAM-dependent methyltransferase [Rhodanobacter sp. AS-Z3]|uniref:class I SAM-dependent methyltransferase n=1 Tax=Rhodanobacter sp. AS-Z3 TaxID=3031330 RepID=UPI00247A7D54|nr:class I SAM-dependent methyltransferase [Rhodanobacter sp. AS-Z3]WEN14944.1 class I SAM-dependent methyltransferase [Rhodanobacter sp. AS-Z3]